MGEEYVRRWIGAILLLVTISAAAVAEEVAPHFNAEVLGLTEDGSHIRVRLHEPDDPDRRVKSLRGYFVYRDRDGQVLVDRPLTARSVGPYPFYRESPRIFEDRMPEGDTRLRRMAQEHPERIAVSLVTTNLEFDDSLASHPRRTISTTRSDEQVRLDYDVREGEAVLFALVTRRWERTWVNPRSGRVFSGNAVDAGMKLSVRVSPPQANDNGAWKLEFGHVDASAWAGSVASIPPDDDEMDVQVRSLELPLLLGDAEAHVIPYRVVGDRTDSVLIIFAKEPATIKDVVRLMPGREDFDWERRFFHVRPFAEGHPQDDNDGHAEDSTLHVAGDNLHRKQRDAPEGPVLAVAAGEEHGVAIIPSNEARSEDARNLPGRIIQQALEAAEQVDETLTRSTLYRDIALLQAMSGDGDSARDTFALALEATLDLNGQRHGALRELVAVKSRAGFVDDAKRLVEENVRRSLRPAAYTAIAQGRAEVGDFDGAMTLADEFEARDPSGLIRPRTLFHVAASQARKGEFDSAKQTAEQIDDSNLASAAYRHIAVNQANDEKLAEAVRTTGQIVDASLHVMTYGYLVRFHLDAMTEDEVESVLMKATQVATGIENRRIQGSNYASIASAMAAAGDLPGAWRLVEKIDRDPDYPINAAGMIAHALAEVGEIEGAMEVASDMPPDARSPSPASAYRAVAVAQAKADELDAAKATVELIDSSRFQNIARRDIAQVLMERGFFTKAVDVMTQMDPGLCQREAFHLLGSAIAHAQLTADEADRIGQWCEAIADPASRAMALLGTTEQLVGAEVELDIRQVPGDYVQRQVAGLVEMLSRHDDDDAALP